MGEENRKLMPEEFCVYKCCISSEPSQSRKIKTGTHPSALLASQIFKYTIKTLLELHLDITFISTPPTRYLTQAWPIRSTLPTYHNNALLESLLQCGLAH